MRYDCPGAGCPTVTGTDKGRRYLPGTYREKCASALVDLRSRVCRTCKHAFIIRTEYPLDMALAPIVETSYNWAEYNNALKNKPGPPQGGTTVSDFTQMIHHDTAGVWWRILGYEKPPNIRRAAAC